MGIQLSTNVALYTRHLRGLEVQNGDSYLELEDILHTIEFLLETAIETYSQYMRLNEELKLQKVSMQTASQQLERTISKARWYPGTPSSHSECHWGH